MNQRTSPVVAEHADPFIKAQIEIGSSQEVDLNRSARKLWGQLLLEINSVSASLRQKLKEWITLKAPLVAHTVKNLPAMQQTQV